MAAPIILHYKSAHAMSTKTAVLTAQIKRAIRIGSNEETKNKGLQIISNLFLKNGYPQKLIRKRIRREHQQAGRGTATQQGRMAKKERDQNAIYVKLPFVDDRVAARVTSVVKSSGLPVRVAWTNRNTLKKQLVRSALKQTPCPSGSQHCHACHAGLQNVCHTKNVVYELVCGLCGKTYVGETSRPVRLRYNEHLRDGVNKKAGTPLGEHFLQEHPDQSPTDTMLTARIVRKCADEADRRIAESITIRDTMPGLNDNTTSWHLLMK